MSPPALVIAGSIVIVAVGTVAFHQFIYEPHIAPKLEVMIENWKEKQRLRRRRLAPAAVYADEDDDASSTNSGRNNDLEGLEMKDISLPLRITGIDGRISEATLRKRTNATGLDEPFVLKSPDPSFIIASLPVMNEKLELGSRSSTPSTFSSSILATQSPLADPTFSPFIDSSPNANLADSLLASPNNFSFSMLSPAQSITHISPRVPVVAISAIPDLTSQRSPFTNPLEFTDSDDEEDNRPLSEYTPRREVMIHYPVLAPSIQVARSPSGSPTGSTIYESFAPSPIEPLSPSAPGQVLPHTGEQATLSLPRSDSFLSPGQRTPQSTTSWSDAGLSENGDEPEFLVGSDVESWANVSDVSRGSRRSRF